MNEVVKVKRKKGGSKPRMGVPRGIFLTVRVTPDEKKAIMEYFGSNTAYRDYIVDLVKAGKVPGNAGVS